MMIDVQVVGGRARKIAWGVLYLYAGWLVAHALLHFSGSIGVTLNFYRTATIDKMVDGSADKPYAGRLLVPLILRGLENFTPGVFQDWLKSIFTSPFFTPDFRNGEPYTFRIGAFYVLCVFVYAGVALGGRAVFKTLFVSQPGWLANLVGLLYLLGVPLWFRYVAYIYDPMTILLATWMLYAALKANLWLFPIVFVLACVNKETAPLALPVFAYCIYSVYPRITTYASTAGLVVLAVLIEAFRQGTTANNKGSGLEYHLTDHQAVIFSAAPMSFLYSLTVMGTLLWLAFTHGRSKPMVLKVGFCFTFGILFLASLPFGYIDEIRALYDGYPYVMMLALPTALSILGLGSGHFDSHAPEGLAAET